MIKEKILKYTGKPIANCSDSELYIALLEVTKELSMARTKETSEKKKLYYVSSEFLIGKLLSNNLINLGVYAQAKELLAESGKDITKIEAIEPEPSLGNGGLGRLAACFLDSMATLGLNADGVGLNYHFGLFKQVFAKNVQTETPNPWIEKKSWLVPTDFTATVDFRKMTVQAKMYDILVTGYENRTNKLHLFDIDTVDESIVTKGISFDKEKIAKNLTLFLYPDDSDEAGHKLRIYQQYFMVSCGAQLILQEAKERGCKLTDLHEYVSIQINDTHPSMIIPELVRLLTAQGIGFEQAADIVSKTCAYTNHTILSEALEKWPLAYLEDIVPQLVQIIKKLDEMVRAKYTNEKVYIIDAQKRVHMAHIDMHYGYSINGVAALHTDILKNSELAHFAEIYPDKFNNKTNGITFRRWLVHCNPKLTALLTEKIGAGFIKDATELDKFIDCIDTDTLKALMDIKHDNKKNLANYLKETQGITINPDSIFDIQIKRLHEYKRQQMNALYIIHKYLEIKKGKLPKRPITIIFGAKAAPAYTIAKDIIHLILCLSKLIAADKVVSQHLNVVMVENYNVTLAEKLIPACDVSEQISLASKEASGTGNMKLMLNGAITLGTMDGANVEIADLVGEDNIYTFGRSSEFVIELYDSKCYGSTRIMEQCPYINELVHFIVEDELMAIGNEAQLVRLYKDILKKDWFMALLDLQEYIDTKDAMFRDYEDQEAWAKMAAINIAKAGFFSSDRTIAQYNDDIWQLK